MRGEDHRPQSTQAKLEQYNPSLPFFHLLFCTSTLEPTGAYIVVGVENVCLERLALHVAQLVGREPHLANVAVPATRWRKKGKRMFVSDVRKKGRRGRRIATTQKRTHVFLTMPDR